MQVERSKVDIILVLESLVQMFVMKQDNSDISIRLRHELPDDSRWVWTR